MITIINILILALISYLTLSFFPHLAIFGVVPLLPLYFLIQLAYYRKGFEPILLAALAGIYFDLFSAYPFGYYLTLFIIVVAIVRYFFGEGLRTLSFWHYLSVSLGAIAAYLLSQTVFLYLEDLWVPLAELLHYLAYTGVNLFYAVIMYFAGRWYFDSLPALENYLKRR